MELKNAVAVCLISLCSATLVVLIARSLDSQAASQLEPHLAGILEELHAIRKQGGISTPQAAAARGDPASDGLTVYYFHSNKRCVNCLGVEEHTRATLESEFGAQLNREQIIWKVLNYQKPSGLELARKFEVKDPVVVLARTRDNELREWKRLDGILGLGSDKTALAAYVGKEIRQMLEPGTQAPRPAAAEPAKPTIPASIPPDLPVPELPADPPVPK